MPKVSNNLTQDNKMSKVNEIIQKGLIFTFLSFLITFSFTFGISYAISNWILELWAIALILAVVFVLCIIIGIKANLKILPIGFMILAFAISSLLFIHGIANLIHNFLLFSIDIWVIYISVCFIIGFLVAFLIETKIIRLDKFKKEQ